MIRNTYFLLLFFTIGLTSQVLAQQSADEPDKAIEVIVGKWQLQKVYAGSREINSNPNSEDRSWIEFNRDGSYNQQSEGTDEGSYRLNENHSVLYLESTQKKETSSAVSPNRVNEYSITIKDNVLTMQPRGENTGSTKFVYTKVGPGSTEEN